MVAIHGFGQPSIEPIKPQDQGFDEAFDVVDGDRTAPSPKILAIDQNHRGASSSDFLHKRDARHPPRPVTPAFDEVSLEGGTDLAAGLTGEPSILKEQGRGTVGSGLIQQPRPNAGDGDGNALIDGMGTIDPRQQPKPSSGIGTTPETDPTIAPDKPAIDGIDLEKGLEVGGNRGMTEGEVHMTSTVFGDAIDYSDVRIYKKKLGMGHIPEITIALDNGVYFHPDGEAYRDDFSMAGIEHQAHFIHEMTHVWQHQQDVLDFFDLFRRSYDYEIVEGQAFDDYGPEQQAEIVRDYFYRLNGHDHVDAPDLSTLQDLIPFAN